VNKKSDPISRTRFAVGDILFLLLLALNVTRTLRHAMWRDELQIFQLGANSRTLVELWTNLRYEAHGILWDALVWGVAHVTANPMWMQVAHATIAAAIWLIVYRASPFTRLEKFLLLLSYFLFFEYFVVARSYALAVLCGFGFVALRQYRPASLLVPWLVLGLMANLVAHATIWSIALALVFAFEEWRYDMRFLLGGALYLALLAFGIATMVPAPDYGPWTAEPAFDLDNLNNALATMLGGFLPLDPGWPHAVRAFLTEPHAPVPFFWNPLPIQPVLAVTSADASHLLRLAAILAVPIGFCALLAGRRVLEFCLAYAGIMVFAVLWHFTGASRHNGLVFVAFVAAVWAARTREPHPPLSLPFVALLGVNALGGVMTLGSEFNTFSQSHNAARWIESNNLALPLIGQRDAQVSSVAGYLGRPVYYLECECRGTFILWNGRRQSPLSTEQFRARLARALDCEGSTAILIRSRPLSADELPSGAISTLLESFTGAITDENYWIYRLEFADTRPAALD
jgi:hypothetical protein